MDGRIDKQRKKERKIICKREDRTGVKEDRPCSEGETTRKGEVEGRGVDGRNG